MATYEYVCMRCEHLFEQQRSMTSGVATIVECPSCGSDRINRRFSFFAPSRGSKPSSGGSQPSSSGGCACGGSCGCGRH